MGGHQNPGLTVAVVCSSNMNRQAKQHPVSLNVEDNYKDKKVETFVTFVNSHLRQRQETERLKNIIARIESYEPVVSLLLFYKVTEEIVL